jgi:hypothetical protein
MNVNEATLATPAKPLRPDPFVKDAEGRTIFYPFGPTGTGYIVPDAEREQQLSAAFERRRAFRRQLLPLLPPVLVGAFGAAYFFFSSHPFLVVAAAVLALVLLNAGETALLRGQFGALLADLPRLGMSDAERTERRHTSWSLLALVAVLTWFALRLYAWRLGALPVEDGRLDYYADISLPLLLAACFGIVLIALMAAQNRIVAQTGNAAKLAMLFVLLALLEAGLVAVVAWAFVSPTLKVVVTPDTITCPRRVSVRWVNVTAIDLITGDYGKKFVEFDMGTEPRPPQPTPYWSPKRITRQCEITGLNVDYGTVYRTVRATWRQARGLPGNDAAGG